MSNEQIFVHGASFILALIVMFYTRRIMIGRD